MLGSANSLPPTIDRAQFAEDMGNFFVQKIVHIRSRLDCHGAVNYHKPDIEGIESSFVFCPPHWIWEFLDPVPSTLVSRCDILLPVLTRLITLTVLGDQSFAAAVPPRLRNSFPYATMSSPSVGSFKQTLNTFLFQKAFMWFYVLFNLDFSRFYKAFLRFK